MSVALVISLIFIRLFKRLPLSLKLIEMARMKL